MPEATITPSAPTPPSPAAERKPDVTVARTYASSPKAVKSEAKPVEAKPATVSAPAVVTPPVASQTTEGAPPVTPADSGTAEPVPATQTLTADEERARRARILRASRKLNAERQALRAEQTRNTELTKRVSLVEQLPQLYARDPLGTLAALGLNPQPVFDAALGDAAKTPQQRAQQELETVQQRIARIEEETKQERAALAKERQNLQVQTHIREQIAPILADEKSYPHLKYAAQLTGDDPAMAIYRTQYAAYQNHIKAGKPASTFKVPSAKAIADFNEKRYAEQAAALRGSNANAKETATTSGTAPPADVKGAQANQAQNSFARKVQKPAYKATVVR